MTVSLFSLVCRQASLSKPAIDDGRNTLIYAELIQAVQRCATLVESQGVSDTPVAICLPRSATLVVASLAVLATGRACVPLDPSHPVDHNRRIVERSGIDLVLTTEDSASAFAGCVPKVLQLPPDPTDLAVTGDSFAERHGDLAFIIHTSGTTGRPKGVMLAQDAMVTLVREVASRMAVNADARVLHFAGAAFDSSTLEWLLALTQGATLHILPDALRDSPTELSEYLVSNRITQALFPAALLPHLPCRTDYAFKALAVVGDVCPANTLWQWAERYPLYNGYGPTESTVCTTLTRVEPGQPISLHDTLDSVRLRINDEQGRPADSGELWIGGSQVALGYWNAPELTETAFFKEGIERWYRSGDRVRRQPEGGLVFLGRSDGQVKLNGQRLELSAIEDRLRELASVRDVRVLLHEPTGAPKRLVAFLASEQPHEAVVAEAKKALLDWPVAHRPAAWHVLPALPLTPNGKVDRAALRALCRETERADPERDALAALVARVLGGYPLGEEEDFFLAGGHSIAMIQLLHQLGQQFDLWLSPSEFRAAPTLAGLRRHLDQPSRNALPVIHPGNSDLTVDHALTPQQAAIWYMHQSAPASKAYLAEAAITFQGPLDVAALEASINRTMARHSIYRTVFVERDGQPLQRVLPEYRLALTCLDRTDVPLDEQSAVLYQLFSEKLPNIAELDREPPVRFLLVRFAECHHVLLHQEHHLIHDGWSANAFTEEVLNRYYAAIDEGQTYAPPPAPQYPDFIAAQAGFLRSEAGQSQLAYWRQQLADCPQGTPLFGRQSRTLAFEGSVERRSLPRAQWQKMEQRCARLGISMFSYTASVVLYCLAHYSDQDDVTLGSAFANRHWGNSQSLLGMMVNTVVLRQQRRRDMTVRDWLNATQALVEQAQANDAYPFGELVAELNPPRSAGSTPYFNVLLGFHDAPMAPSLPDGLTCIKDETVESGTSKFDLDCLVVPRPGNAQADDAVQFLWEYRTDVYSKEDIQAFLIGFEKVFNSALDQLDQPIDQLVIELEGLVTQLLEWGRGPSLPHDSSLTFSHRWQQRCVARRDATAIIEGEHHLSYAELDRQARFWADQFRSAGLAAGEVIALNLPRGNELVVAMLAVWLFGGVVLVIEPDLPEARQLKILERARPAARVSIGGDIQCFERPVERLFPLDAESAYIIFTSGSTGEPKGVVVSHRAFGNVCAAHQSLFELDQNTRGACLATPGFDAYLAEVWPVLLAGGTLIHIADEERIDWAALAQRLQQTGITHLCFSTGLFEAAQQTGFQWPDTLRTLLTGGDRLGAVDLPHRPGLRLFNMYGPTETTVDALLYELTHHRTSSPPPIGRPLPNARAVVLGRDGRLAPVGVEGDLWIGGVGIAQGYLDDPDQTAQRFVPGCRLHEALTGRYYRTGDRASWSRDGQLLFHGRQDDEVKIRGHRVDLNEVTATLTADERVAQAVCRFHNGTLLAYAVPSASTQTDLVSGVTTSRKLARQLSKGLRRDLPAYMRPNSLMIIDAIPLTRQGKVDKAALPLPLEQIPEAVAPGTELERELVALWRQVLDREIPSVTESFFALGGHSLLAMTLQARLRQTYGVDMTMEDFFNHFTVRDQARYIEAARLPMGEPGSADEVFEEGSL